MDRRTEKGIDEARAHDGNAKDRKENPQASRPLLCHAQNAHVIHLDRRDKGGNRRARPQGDNLPACVRAGDMAGQERSVEFLGALSMYVFDYWLSFYFPRKQAQILQFPDRALHK